MSTRTTRIGLGLAIALALPAGTAFAQATTTPDAPTTAPAADLPSARSLFDKHIEALGGPAALKKLKNRSAEGTFSMPAAGITASMAVKQKAPNLMVMQLDIPNMGVMKQGYDGKTGWRMDPMAGPSLIEGGELVEWAREADLQYELNIEKYFPKMETVSRTDFHGKPVYEVAATDAGGKVTKMYFSTESGLLIGQRGKADSQMGPMTQEILIEKYMEADGLKFPSKSKIVLPEMGMTQIIEVKSVSYDEIEADAFKLPDAIRALKSDD